jgi:hypothetical protein
MATFKSDLAKADIRHIDGAGRVMDFHGLRYSCGTMLAKAGVAPRTAMEIMRHTDIRLTMGLYTDPTILNTSRAINELPSLTDEPVKAQGKAVGLKTGTDGLPVQMPNQSIALNRGPHCPNQSFTVHFGESAHTETPVNTGVSDGGGGNRTRVPRRFSVGLYVRTRRFSALAFRAPVREGSFGPGRP